MPDGAAGAHHPVFGAKGLARLDAAAQQFPDVRAVLGVDRARPGVEGAREFAGCGPGTCGEITEPVEAAGGDIPLVDTVAGAGGGETEALLRLAEGCLCGLAVGDVSDEL